MPKIAPDTAARLSVAPMMDGNDSCSISMVWAMACAVYVHALIP